MTLPELLSNEDLRRHQFPVSQEHTFLAHAGVCPLPRRVAERIDACARACTLSDQEEAFAGGRILQVRQLAARLLNAQFDEIALVGPTSLALSFVAAGLALRK